MQEPDTTTRTTEAQAARSRKPASLELLDTAPRPEGAPPETSNLVPLHAPAGKNAEMPAIDEEAPLPAAAGEASKEVGTSPEPVPEPEKAVSENRKVQPSVKARQTDDVGSAAEAKRARKTEKPEKAKKVKAEKPKKKPKKRKAEKPKDGSLSFDDTVPLNAAASYFEDIMTGFAKGTIHFEKGKKSLVIKPADACHVKIKASRKGKKERVKFDISWRQAS